MKWYRFIRAHAQTVWDAHLFLQVVFLESLNVNPSSSLHVIFTGQDTEKNKIPQFPSEASHTVGTQPQSAESQVQGALQWNPISFFEYVQWFAQLGLTNHRNVLPFHNLRKVFILQSWYYMGFGFLYLPIPKVTLRWGLHNAICPRDLPRDCTRAQRG